MASISVVIPAFNEKVNIGISLNKVTSFLNEFMPDYEIIVVDDGSTDGTSTIVETFVKVNTKIILIQNLHKGKGFAVRTGVLNSKKDFILLFDADSATPIEELKRLMVWMVDNNFDVAIGSREGVGAQRNNEPFIRHFMGRVFNTLIKFLLLPGINDTQCGFKLFKGDQGRKIFERSLLYKDPGETKFPKVTAFDVEILLIAVRMNLKIKEVPVVWEYGKTTKVNKFRDSFINFMDVMRVKVNDIKGLYRFS